LFGRWRSTERGDGGAAQDRIDDGGGEVKMATDYKFAAWVGTWDDETESYHVAEDDIMFTDSLEDAQAFRCDQTLEPGQTLGISDADGVAATVSYVVDEDEARFETWAREAVT
jgi:hypothetical protein